LIINGGTVKHPSSATKFIGLTSRHVFGDNANHQSGDQVEAHMRYFSHPDAALHFRVFVDKVNRPVGFTYPDLPDSEDLLSMTPEQVELEKTKRALSQLSIVLSEIVVENTNLKSLRTDDETLAWAEGEIQQAQNERDAAVSRADELEQQLQAYQGRGDIEQQIIDLEQQLSDAQSSHHITKRQLDTVTGHLKDEKDGHEKTKGRLASVSADRRQLQTIIDRASELVGKHNTDNKQLVQAISEKLAEESLITRDNLLYLIQYVEDPVAAAYINAYFSVTDNGDNLKRITARLRLLESQDEEHNLDDLDKPGRLRVQLRRSKSDARFYKEKVELYKELIAIMEGVSKALDVKKTGFITSLVSRKSRSL
jgi:hypothetical protein